MLFKFFKCKLKFTDLDQSCCSGIAATAAANISLQNPQHLTHCYHMFIVAVSITVWIRVRMIQGSRSKARHGDVNIDFIKRIHREKVALYKKRSSIITVVVLFQSTISIHEFI